MSGGRDADVMVETVDALADRFAGQLPKRQFTTLRRRFAEHADQARADSEVGELASGLADARERAAAWPLGHLLRAPGAPREGRVAVAGGVLGHDLASMVFCPVAHIVPVEAESGS